MNYNFIVENEKIKDNSDLVLYSGNINTYTFTFQFDENWSGLVKFASFAKGSETYTVLIERDSLAVPAEVLENAGMCFFGVYATNGSDDVKRMSSERLQMEIKKGAYSKGEVPHVPTPDVWETLFRKSIPAIKDGYWHIYNPEAENFENTGVCTSAPIPQKGVDYWNEEDVAEIKSYVDGEIVKVTGDMETALENILSMQRELTGESIIEVPNDPTEDEKDSVIDDITPGDGDFSW